MRISDWSSDVCSSDLRLYYTFLSRTAPCTNAAHQQLGAGVFGRSAWHCAGRGLDKVQGALRSLWVSHARRRPQLSCLVRTVHANRSEEHTSELQSLMRISYAVFCLKKKKRKATSTKINRKQIDNTTQIYRILVQ